MKDLYTRKFWQDAMERAVSTFVQAAGALILLSQNATDLLQINWLAGLSAGLVAAALSIVKSLYAATKNNTDSASLVEKL